MSSIPSEAISTCQSMRSPVVNHRLVALDEGAYRRQIEHFEYHWGMQKGELDLHSPLNHIQLREDMVSSLNDLEWILMPTKATLNAMYRMAEYNQSADIHSRKHFLTEFPEEEYEYDFVPLYYLKHRHTLDRGSALPRPGRDSDDEDEQDSFWEPWAIREWRANILARAPQLPSDAKSRRDDMLARYRREPPRDARDALDPDNSNFCSSGLIIGNGVDWSGYSSNNWAKHIYNKCLMNRDPICLP
ncbi:hypothetical protein K525DRAFT_269276 [Schizophyllum commune Loenen D]|nr:hypothetical protein K525DRAFT_269276 [Schizophyllum commune Loenen D]